MPKFDCVVLSHVLEHVYDIPSFFAAARRLLTPGGYLYLETPDATRYDQYLYAPFQEFNTEHINHFSARALDNTSRRFGFEPVLVEQKVFKTAADTCTPLSSAFSATAVELPTSAWWFAIRSYRRGSPIISGIPASRWTGSMGT
jgi:predicted SAM-dependent methyltransferase